MEAALDRPDSDVVLDNGLRLTFDPADSRTGAPLVLLPAMGVPARFYDRFTANLNRLGHDVVRVHWRDEDRDFPIKNKNYGYADLAETDVPAAVEWTRQHTGEAPILLGHSLGGQVASISAGSCGELAGIAIVASGTNYWRGSGLRWALGVGFVSLVVAPLVTRIVGYWPGGRLGFGGRQPARLIRDWARLGRTGRFEPTGATVDLETRMRGVDLPILAINIGGDIYVSRGATENLLQKMQSAQIERIRWRPDDRHFRGHFNWVRADDGPAQLISVWAADQH